MAGAAKGDDKSAKSLAGDVIEFESENAGLAATAGRADESGAGQLFPAPRLLGGDVGRRNCAPVRNAIHAETIEAHGVKRERVAPAASARAPMAAEQARVRALQALSRNEAFLFAHGTNASGWASA